MTSGVPERDGGTAVSPAHQAPGTSFEAFSELMADRLPSAAIAVDDHGRVMLANRAAASYLDAPPEAMRGQSLAEVLGLAPQLIDALHSAIAGDGGALSVGVGDDLAASITLSVLPCRHGDRHHGALILFDRHTESQSSAAVDDDATRRLASLGRLSAGVAHEIRNPLSGIGTNAQVLRRRLEDGDPRIRFVDFILEEVNRLDKIIEDLLRFARPPEPRMVAHDVRESIERVLMQAAGRIDEAGVEVAVDVEGEPALAFVDPDQVAQVLLNLVLNALQAMSEGGRLEIELREVEKLGPVVGRMGRRAGDRQASGPKRRFLEIVVRDNGVGIDEADLPKLFEPFFTTRPSGTGLGLSTCQVLIRQQGGAVSVESELGKGTAVTVLIPVEKRRAAR
jgi:signal transduction histidine kinase